MLTSGSMFSGGGLADIGIMAAGFKPAFAIEKDSDITQVYRQNLGDHVIVEAVENINMRSLPPVNLLQASPVCTRASKANKRGEEAELDITAAFAVARYIYAQKPEAVIIENVREYANFKSFKIILKALEEERYFYHYSVINAADYGVPQSRERLILRARRGGLLNPLPWPTARPGWFSAVEDLIDSLPDSELAEWQIKLLPEKVKETILFDAKNSNHKWGKNYKYPEAPAFTIVNYSRPSHIPLIIDGTPGNNGKYIARRADQEPVFTIGASQTKRPLRMVIDGQVKRLTPRALARLQTVPDWYRLPDNNNLACKIIGNGIPCKLAEVLAKAAL